MTNSDPRSRLSKGEWLLMNICWRRGQATARQIFDDSLKRRERDYRTVKTMLDRMAAKGYLEIEKLGPLCLYTPLVNRRETLSEAISEFVDIVLDKTFSPLLVHLAEEESLSEEDLASLRKLVDSSEEDTS